MPQQHVVGFDYQLVVDVLPCVVYSEDRRLDRTGAFVVHLLFGGPSLAVYFEIEVLQLLVAYFEVLDLQVCFDLQPSVAHFEVLDSDLEGCSKVLDLQVCSDLQPSVAHFEVLDLDLEGCLEVLDLQVWFDLQSSVAHFEVLDLDLEGCSEVLDQEDHLVCFEVRVIDP